MKPGGHQPEVSSVRDSDRILGILASKSRRAERNEEPIKGTSADHPLCPARVDKGEMLSVENICDILCIPLIGVVPESQAVLLASNEGVPVIHKADTDVAQAYQDVVSRSWATNCRCAFWMQRPSLACSSAFWRLTMSLIDRWLGRSMENSRQPWRMSVCRLSSPMSAMAAPARPIICRRCKKSCWRVISKYVAVSAENIKVQLERQDQLEVPEVNIVLPDLRDDSHRIALASWPWRASATLAGGGGLLLSVSPR